jgi:DNA-binding NarL/FixJ family response regulator
VLDPGVVAHVVGRSRDQEPLADLPPQEREVPELMAQRLSNRPICEQLAVTERPVERHVTSIFTNSDCRPAAGNTAECFRCSHS